MLTFASNYSLFKCAQFIRKHFQSSFGTPAVFLHTQIVYRTAFIVSSSNHRDKITIYSHKNGTCLHRQTKNDVI